MGFSLTCMIYSPVKRDDLAPGVVLWHPDEVFDCKYINRQVQAVVDDGKNIEGDYYVENPHTLVGTAMITLLYKRFPGYAREQGKRIFAPPFLLEKMFRHNNEMFEYQGRGLKYHDDVRQWLKNLKAGGHRLLPKEGMQGTMWPSLIEQTRHNNEDPDDVTEIKWFIGSCPFCWAPCSVVSDWLDDFWQRESTSRLMMDNHSRAKARLRGWHEQLRAYSVTGSYLICVFRSYNEYLL